MKENLYFYKATVERVIDGDTIVLVIDKGFYDFSKKSVRLFGINTPELRSSNPEEKKKAKEAKSFLEGILTVGTKVIIKSKELDKYGRPIAVIYLDDVNINEVLLNSGHAKAYEEG